MNKVFKIIFDVIFIISIIILGLYFLLRLLKIAEIYEVRTGSMEDDIHVGDYILIIKKSDYKVRDVVTYEKDGYYVTHRIIKKNKNKVITKGDANNVADEEIKASSIVGKVIYHGGILNFLIKFKYFIVCGLLGLYLLSTFFNKKIKEQE